MTNFPFSRRACPPFLRCWRSERRASSPATRVQFQIALFRNFGQNKPDCESEPASSAWSGLSTRLYFSAILSAVCISSGLGQTFKITADKSSGIYHVGDTVRWTVSEDGPRSAGVKYSIEPGQGKANVTGTLDLSKDGSATVEYTFTKPTTVLLEIGKSVGGAIANAAEIQPSALPPSDFDEFWKTKLQELDSVPMHPESVAADSGSAEVRYEKVTLANVRHKTIHAQLAMPVSGQKFPGLLIVQWAGVYGLDKTWVTDWAKDGWLALDVMPHDLPIDQTPDYYKVQFDGPLKNYWTIGNDNRETSYFLPMYLSCYRAVEYLRSRPDWDGKTLVVMGGSQGGQQSLMIAGLYPGFTAAMANVPAGCDMLGPTAGRRGGWPQWYDWTTGKDPAKVHEASRYFDVVNFAGHIKCPVLVGAGLIDQTCPAAGVCAAFDQITAPKDLVLMPLSGHQSQNGSQAAYDKRLWGTWLPALVKGHLPTLPE